LDGAVPGVLGEGPPEVLADFIGEAFLLRLEGAHAASHLVPLLSGDEDRQRLSEKGILGIGERLPASPPLSNHLFDPSLHLIVEGGRLPDPFDDPGILGEEERRP